MILSFGKIVENELGFGQQIRVHAGAQRTVCAQLQVALRALVVEQKRMLLLLDIRRRPVCGRRSMVDQVVQTADEATNKAINLTPDAHLVHGRT